MPINQVSMQFNSIIMALAGADRVFRLLDEKPEEDEGYVMLVNVKRTGDGSLTRPQNVRENGHGDMNIRLTDRLIIFLFRDISLWMTWTSVMFRRRWSCIMFR